MRRLALLVCALSLAGMPLGVRVARADFVVNANRPIVVSDDVTDQTTSVVSLGDAVAGNDCANAGGGVDGTSCSGLGDASNPGQGAQGESGNSSNPGANGVDNPNKSKK
jgi:hypothetical protein